MLSIISSGVLYDIIFISLAQIPEVDVDQDTYNAI